MACHLTFGFQIYYRDCQAGIMPDHKTAHSSIDIGKPDHHRLRLRYLEGLRGLAALYVILFHAYKEVDGRLDGSIFPPLIHLMTKWMTYGRLGVSVFIVLSGYCLMLPVIQSINGQLRGGVDNYLKRRAWRILPPYYAVLVLSLLLFKLVPAELQPSMGFTWNYDTQPAFDPGVLLSHFLLLHNLNPEWAYKINSPMWSVATEWQIYFLFPTLLLPIWRCFGIFPVLGIAFALGLAPHFLLNGYIDHAAPWYLGSFALGMVAAVINFSIKPSLISWRNRIRWGKMTVVLLLCLVIVAAILPGHNAWVYEPIAGVVVACFLISCTFHLTEGKGKNKCYSAILQLLESPWTVGLGTFSYSIYLVHMPVLCLSQIPLINLPLSPTAKLLIMIVHVIPISLVIAYVFHLVFERPLISNYFDEKVKKQSNNIYVRRKTALFKGRVYSNTPKAKKHEV